MQKDYPAPQGFIDLIERKYNVKIIDSHYILVDEKFQQYNMMLNVRLNSQMKEAFVEKYGKQDSDMCVEWEWCPKTDSIRFFADKGNNILLFWDSLQ
ncbi:hypothetical protein [Megamonas hypermegale]|uniref:hypothetical protein n=1 Tax=Megamonas hypermegale TaxID=158847 RepID=UPI0025A3FB08|nr:hypothetical protein [Megamonas hypermegale]MDM8143393.1 hypothetical protein [Megamonas hypermegale]